MTKHARQNPRRRSQEPRASEAWQSGDARSRGPSDVEQLRAAIDAGKTGDKVAYPDPAAAPLGADDEAAGQTAVPEAGQEAVGADTAASGLAQRASAAHEPRRSVSPWLIGVPVLIVVLVAAGLALT